MKYLWLPFLLAFASMLFPLNSYEEPLYPITSTQEFRQLYSSVNDYAVIENGKVARIFLVRHGENEANAKDLIDGRTLDLPLTEKGKVDAHSAGQAIAQKIDRIDLLLSSPLLRARETAQEIAYYFDLASEIIIDERLIERYHGIFEGQPGNSFAPAREQLEQVLPYLVSLKDKFEYREHPSMENYQETYERMSAAILEWSKEHLGKNVVMTTHGNVLRSLFHMRNAEQHNVFVPNTDFFPNNGAILIIESDGNVMTLKAFQGFSCWLQETNS